MLCPKKCSDVVTPLFAVLLGLGTLLHETRHVVGNGA